MTLLKESPRSLDQVEYPNPGLPPPEISLELGGHCGHQPIFRTSADINEHRALWTAQASKT